MADKTQESMGLSLPANGIAIPAPPKAETVDEDEEAARQELARITPSNEELMKMAAKSGPLPKWLDEDEECPFDPIEE